MQKQGKNKSALTGFEPGIKSDTSDTITTKKPVLLFLLYSILMMY